MKTYKIELMRNDLIMQTFMYSCNNEQRPEPEMVLNTFFAEKYYKYNNYTYYREHTFRIEEAEVPYYMGINNVWYLTVTTNGRRFIYVTINSEEEV